MFIDETTIKVAAGDGGNGCFAYEKERFRPLGRPSGGDGGNGGSIIVQVSHQMHTLLDASYRKSYTANRGDHGQGSYKTGKRGEDIIIKVPIGTIISDAATNRIICDCLIDNEQYIVAKGGKGGRGNGSIYTARNRNPEQSEPGKPGDRKHLKLVLKILADVGLVGRPNAGKSTLLSRISKARPKIADYPFTTKEPNLGIVHEPGNYKSFVVADIPGLIEGSHKGKGLGIRFLKHIERTKILAIMVDCQTDDPQAEADMLIHELSEYSPLLAQKPKCFFMTKIDIFPEIVSTLPKGWMALSALSGDGMDKAIGKFIAMLKDEDR